MRSTIRNSAFELSQQSEQTLPVLITEADLLKLPEAMQRYLRYTRVIGKEPIQTVRLKQRGFFRTQPGQMKHTLVRLTIGVAETFIALSTIAGGIVLLAGTYKDGVLIEAGGRGQFPLEWLHNTPFSDFTIPALVLAIGVGGSSLIAAVLVFTGREEGELAAVVAGLIMAGYIVVEVIMLRQGVSWIEGLYFGLGLAISGLASSLWMVEHRAHHLQIKQT